jgi:amino acid permease
MLALLEMDTSDSDIGLLQMVSLLDITLIFVTDWSGPILNGINGFGQVFVLAAAYYVGTEIISLAAGETKNPRKSIPNVCHAVMFLY